jgi:integrase
LPLLSSNSYPAVTPIYLPSLLILRLTSAVISLSLNFRSQQPTNQGNLPRNVANKIAIPEPLEQEFDEDADLVKVFTAEQITTLERHTIDTPYYALVALALRTGMRRSELLSLTWEYPINMVPCILY